MSLSSVNGSSNAASYLRSLLQQQSAQRGKAAGSADPMTSLLNVFYPTSGASQSGATQDTGMSAAPCAGAAALSPDTMAQLISAQEQRHHGAEGRIAARAESLFGKMDANQDGKVDQTEFENVFGATADMSKVDGLLNALDTDSDGAISQDELTSAAQQSHTRRHHHHVRNGGAGEGSGFDMLMSATQGATTQTSANADGSTTTTISYADGSQVTMTLPATAASSSSDDGAKNADRNAIERLIRLQAQLLTPSASSTTSA
jgi:hypothetical protein